MASHGFALGIDFGTSNTAAVLRWPDGQVKPLIFDASPLLRSGTYVEADGSVLVGRDSLHSAQHHPHRFEPHPKSRIDEDEVLLGDQAIATSTLIAGVLRRVYHEALRVAGGSVTGTTITYPASWGATRRSVLLNAAVEAGIHNASLVAEPIAAGAFFAQRMGPQLPPGANLLVYDFGGGTFDASVVRRTDNGFEVRASEGLDDTGGADIDAAIMASLGVIVSNRSPDIWRRLTQPATDTDRRAAMQLWEDVRQAKELLSRSSHTLIQIPLLDEAVPLGIEELTRLMRPIVERTISATRMAMASAGITRNEQLQVLLVGGSSRIPLVATMLHGALDIAPVTLDQPELVVAEGSLPALERITGTARVAEGPSTPAPTSGAPASGAPASGAPASGGGFILAQMPENLGGGPVPLGGPISGGPGGPGGPIPGGPGGPVGPISGGPGGPGGPVPGGYGIPATGGYGGPGGPGGPISGGPAGPGFPGGAGMPGGVPPTHRPPLPPPPHLGPQFPPGGPPPGFPYPPPPPPPKKRGPLIAAAAALTVIASLGVFAIIKSVGGDDTEQVSGSVTTEPLDPPTTEVTKPTGPPACNYKIGFLGPLTGTAKAYAESVRNGATLALEKYNTDHTGCETELVNLDSKGAETATTRTIAEQAVADAKVLGVVGPMWQTEVEAAQPLFEAADIATISPTAAFTGLSQKGWKTFHRLISPEAIQAGVVGQHLDGDTTVQRVFLIHDTTAVGKELVGAVSDKVGRKLVGTTTGFVTAAELAAAVTAIKTANADTVYFGGYAKPAADLVKALSAAKNYPMVYTGSPVFDGSFITQAGDATSISRVTCSCLPPEKISGNFIQEFRARFNQTPTFGAAEAYDAMSVFLAGLEVGIDSRAEMLEFVDAYTEDGLTGQIKFDQNGDPAGTTDHVFAFRVQGGYFVGDQELTTG